MLRTVALALIAFSLAACASTPRSETASLTRNIHNHGGSAKHCPATKYCVTTGSRARSENISCSCGPPPALMGPSPSPHH